jgi:hypothetical protein
MSTKIDARTEDAIDAQLQQELLRNERVVTHPKFGAVRLRRPNPDQERSVGEKRRKQFHADMKDPDILSRDELETLAIARGMWSATMKERIEDLTTRTGQAIGLLDAIGFRDVNSLLADLDKVRASTFEAMAEAPEATEALDRYFNLDVEQTTADRNVILEQATSSAVDDLLDRADTLRQQITILLEMATVRKELSDLNMKQAKLFADSLEARADRAEELARIYYCSSLAATGAPLWPTYEAMWLADTDEVTWLIEQMYFFVHGITEEQMAVLGRFGFLQRLSDTSDSSDDSPAQPQSKPDGEPAESKSNLSSEATE